MGTLIQLHVSRRLQMDGAGYKWIRGAGNGLEEGANRRGRIQIDSAGYT